MGLFRLISICLACPLLVAAVSCAPGGSAAYLRRTTPAANDHIMLVRQIPPTFGFRRLAALAEHYPDLAVFIRAEGMPEFLAETNKSGNRYLILYYPGTRRAFACRGGAGNSRRAEFSGPYPITDNELKTLRKLEGSAPAAGSQRLNRNFAAAAN